MLLGAFNRTSLELKHYFGTSLTLVEGTPFNRTSLELKREIDDAACGFVVKPFNRTSLELKLMRCGMKAGWRWGLLIAPVWN